MKNAIIWPSKNKNKTKITKNEIKIWRRRHGLRFQGCYMGIALPKLALQLKVIYGRGNERIFSRIPLSSVFFHRMTSELFPPFNLFADFQHNMFNRFLSRRAILPFLPKLEPLKPLSHCPRRVQEPSRWARSKQLSTRHFVSCISNRIVWGTNKLPGKINQINCRK